MKKFCSECGHPLEISKKFCSDCGNANPFFTLSLEIPNARSGAIDTLLARKESIEKELEEIKREQEENLRKEKFRAEMEELERQRMARMEKEKEIKERFEREKIEAVFKKELQQVKEENEQYKKQTTDLLKELRQVIFQIDEENRKLKEEVLQIAKAQPVQTSVEEKTVAVVAEEIFVPPTVEEMAVAQENSLAEMHEEEKPVSANNTVKWGLAVVLFLALVSTATLAHFYFSQQTDNTPKATAIEQQPVSEPEPAVLPVATEEPVAETENHTATITSEPASTSAIPATDKPVTATTPVVAEKPKEKSAAFSLSVLQARTDLIGQKLSGCGITLSTVSEVQNISNPVLVENSAASGYLKYKLTMNVTQGGETYYVTPYLYYSPAGKFMRVDASNCE
ncbi:MAG: hypothetical protein KIS94_07650 [Chitinophagales bacterium]|nr:hypothetical protein [Chitinophagales bacterium]